MQVIEREAKTDQGYALEVAQRGRGTFQSKELRDRVFNLIKELHPECGTPRKRIVTSQNLHPEYVTDYVGTLEIGFGNTQYQTFWSKLYCIHVDN